jgi:hypothetical protein
VLLGAAGADEAAPPATPAGRFTARTLASARGSGIVWANDKSQLALFAVPPADTSEQQRLDSPRAQDKRVSEGSLHVAASFFSEYLQTLRTQPSVAYVLPETIPVDQLFGTSPARPESVVERSGHAGRPS